MNPVLVHIRPLDQRRKQRVDVRVADGPNADTYGVGGVPWAPALTSRPTLSIELMSPDMDGRVKAGQARFEIALNQLFGRAYQRDLYWGGAEVTIQSTGILEGPTAVPDFWGYVTDGRPDRETGRLSITAEVSTAFIDKPLLEGEFTGGGGLTGDAGKRGTLFPLGMGSVKNIQPVWFDLNRNIGMIDGYGNTLAITWLAEGLSSFGDSVGDYATYAELAAAIDAKIVKPGQWATCIAEGLVGLGAPPTGIITVHAVFRYNRIGTMMKSVLLDHAKTPLARVDVPAFDALDAAVDKPVHFWTDQQGNTKELLQAMAQSCNATPLVSFQNKVTVLRAIGGAPVATLDCSGGQTPRVLNWTFADNEPPYSILKARAQRPASVLTDDQVNYKDTLVDQGLFNPATVYRSGNLVYLADGSQWLYQNDSPEAGHYPPSTLPPDGNGFVYDNWWFRRRPPTKASDITYDDGTPIEVLKPATKGATAGAPGDSPIGGTIDPATGTVVGGRSARSIVNTVDINTASVLAGTLRDDDLEEVLDARTLVEGQPVGPTFLNFRYAQQDTNRLVNTALSLIGAKTADGTGWVLNLDTVQIGPIKLGQRFAGLDNLIGGLNGDLASLDGEVGVLSTKLIETGAKLGDVEATSALLLQAFTGDDTGVAGFTLTAKVDNGGKKYITGIAGLAGPGGEELNFVSENFNFVRPGGGSPLKLLSYNGALNRWEFSVDVYAKKVAAESITAGDIKSGAVQRTSYARLTADVSVGQNQTSSVISVNINKDENSSVLDIQFFGMFKSADDIQFAAQFLLDNGTAYPAGRNNIVLDSKASEGEITLTPFTILEGIPAGPHSIAVTIQNKEVDPIDLVMLAGSILKVIELKNAAL